MKSALELLDVIESSHLPLTEKLSEVRDNIIHLVDVQFQRSRDADDQLAAGVAALLLQEGVVLGDQESIEEVVAEYLHVVADEEAGLGDEEKDFLEGFLK